MEGMKSNSFVLHVFYIGLFLFLGIWWSGCGQPTAQYCTEQTDCQSGSRCVARVCKPSSPKANTRKEEPPINNRRPPRAPSKDPGQRGRSPHPEYHKPSLNAAHCQGNYKPLVLEKKLQGLDDSSITSAVSRTFPWMAHLTKEGTVFLFHTREGQLLHSFRLAEKHRKDLKMMSVPSSYFPLSRQQLLFHPKLARLYFISHKSLVTFGIQVDAMGKLSVKELEARKLPFTFFYRATIHPNGSFMVLSVRKEKAPFQLWIEPLDKNAGFLKQEIPWDTKPTQHSYRKVLHLEFDPKGRWLVASETRWGGIWSYQKDAKGRSSLVFKRSLPAVGSFAFHPKKDWMVFSGTRRLTLVSLASLQILSYARGNFSPEAKIYMHPKYPGAIVSIDSHELSNWWLYENGNIVKRNAIRLGNFSIRQSHYKDSSGQFFIVRENSWYSFTYDGKHRFIRHPGQNAPLKHVKTHHALPITVKSAFEPTTGGQRLFFISLPSQRVFHETSTYTGAHKKAWFSPSGKHFVRYEYTGSKGAEKGYFRIWRFQNDPEKGFTAQELGIVKAFDGILAENRPLELTFSSNISSWALLYKDEVRYYRFSLGRSPSLALYKTVKLSVIPVKPGQRNSTYLDLGGRWLVTAAYSAGDDESSIEARFWNLWTLSSKADNNRPAFRLHWDRKRFPRGVHITGKFMGPNHTWIVGESVTQKGLLAFWNLAPEKPKELQTFKGNAQKSRYMVPTEYQKKTPKYARNGFRYAPYTQAVRPLFVLNTLYKDYVKLKDIQFHPSGHQVVLLTETLHSGASMIQLWDMKSRKRVQLLPGASVWAGEWGDMMHFWSDKQRSLVLSSSKQFKVWTCQNP